MKFVSPGQRVIHLRYGRGTVENEWGTFYSCRFCFRPLHSQNAVCCGEKASIVNGAGIYDVLFHRDGLTRSINRVWLLPSAGAIHDLFRRTDMKRVLLVLTVTCLAFTTSAQTTWYKFSKDFINSHYPNDCAIGKLEAKTVAPAKNVHAISCGGNDGELHIGIERADVVGPGADGQPFSAPADADGSDFGVVAEPVNLASSTKSSVGVLDGEASTFEGYYRLWNEGHDTGTAAPSNPHHVLELHPVWAFTGAGENFSDPASIHPMRSGNAVYRGYGASKFRPLLESLSNEEWLHVYEDDTFVYVELRKAENFYQLPVTVNDRHDVSGGVEATVDVFSDTGHHNQVLSGLHVIANTGSDIAGQLNSADNIRFLLGIFSVNLRKAEDLARGHRGQDNAVFAPSALEFFAYGVPLGRAVASSSGCR